VSGEKRKRGRLALTGKQRKVRKFEQRFKNLTIGKESLKSFSVAEWKRKTKWSILSQLSWGGGEKN